MTDPEPLEALDRFLQTIEDAGGCNSHQWLVERAGVHRTALTRLRQQQAQPPVGDIMEAIHGVCTLHGIPSRSDHLAFTVDLLTMLVRIYREHQRKEQADLVTLRQQLAETPPNYHRPLTLPANRNALLDKAFAANDGCISVELEAAEIKLAETPQDARDLATFQVLYDQAEGDCRRLHRELTETQEERDDWKLAHDAINGQFAALQQQIRELAAQWRNAADLWDRSRLIGASFNAANLHTCVDQLAALLAPPEPR